MPIFLPRITKEAKHKISFRYNVAIKRTVDTETNPPSASTPYVEDYLLVYHGVTNYNHPQNLFRTVSSSAPSWFFNNPAKAKAKLRTALQAPLEVLRDEGKAVWNPWPGGVHAGTLKSKAHSLDEEQYANYVSTKWSQKVIEELQNAGISTSCLFIE